MSALHYLGKITFLGLFISYFSICQAAVVETPDISNWIASWKASPGIKNIPRKITVIQKWRDTIADKGVASFSNLEPADCAAAGYLTCDSHKDLNWTVTINRVTASKLIGLPGVRKLTDAEIIISPNSKNGWSIQFKDSDSITPINWKPDQTQSNAKGILNAIHSALGYEGIVLDQKNGFLLIGSSADVLIPDDIQGLVLGGSDKTDVISKNAFKGTALISKVAFQGGFGIFKLVTTDGSTPTIPLGTKAIIEKSKTK